MDIDVKAQAHYWHRNATIKWKTAVSLIESKRYADALFFCHLTIECLLKSLVVYQSRDIAPYIHDLLKLLKKAGLVIEPMMEEQLRVINTFNIAARYPEEKFSFYKKANKKYATEWFIASNKLRLWLLREYKKVKS